MQEREISELRQRLAGNYKLEEENGYWIVARKDNGQVLATVLLNESYGQIREQLAHAGVTE